MWESLLPPFLGRDVPMLLVASSYISWDSPLPTLKKASVQDCPSFRILGSVRVCVRA